MFTYLSGKIRKIPSTEVSEDRYSYFQPGEAELDLGVPAANNGIVVSDVDGTRDWLYPDLGLAIDANNNLYVDVTTAPLDSNGFFFTSGNTLFDAIQEMDSNIYNAVLINPQRVTTDDSLLGDGTANNALGVNPDFLANTIFDTVTAEFINELNIDADTLDGANSDFYLDWTNTTNKPSPNVEITLEGDVAGTSTVTLTELQSANVVIQTTVQPDSVELGIDTFGDYVESVIAGVGITIDNANGESSTPTISIGQDVSNEANVVFNNGEFTGDLTIGGDITISGNVVSLSVETLEIEDNLIYLNANSAITNPDLGWSGNYNDGTYAHAGFFRDATDGRFKAFDGYTPEPDESPYINTAHESFNLAGIQAGRFFGPLTGDVTGTADLVASLSNFTTDNLAEGASKLYHTPDRVNTLIDARVTKTFVDGLNVDADTLDGLDSTYLLNYLNLTNKPIIGDGELTVNGSNGLSGTGTFTANQVDPTTITLQNTDRGSSQFIFKNIVIPGEDNIVAGSNDDTITIVPTTNNVILTTDAANNTIYLGVEAVETDVYVDSVTFDDVAGTLTFTRTGGLPDIEVTIAQLSANAQIEITYDLVGDSVINGAVVKLVDQDGASDNINIVGTGATDVNWSAGTQTITIDSTDTTYNAGAGLDLVGTTFSHEDTSSVADIAPSTGQYIAGITFDTYGHVQTVTTADDYYVTSGSFNANTSTLSLTRSGGLANVDIVFEGLQFEEVDTLDSVTTRGNSTDNTLNVGSLVAANTVSANTIIGDVIGTVSSLANHTTDDLAEGATNQYYTVSRANTAIDNRVTKSFVDALGIDADTFDGADSSFYLNYNNLLNAPQSIFDFGIIDGNAGDILTTDGNQNLSFQSFSDTLDYEAIANNLFYLTTTAPEDPYNKQLWFDYDDGLLYFYDSVNGTPQWRMVQVTAAQTFYADVSNTAPLSVDAGYVWFDTDDATISVYTGNTWVVASGPAGPVGPQGETGPEGPEGPTGPEGETGADGLDGVDGTVAEVANTAPEPPTTGQLWYDTTDATISVYNGNTWVVTSGPAGPTGPAGPQGETGPEGPEGPTGETGADGLDGADGTVAEVANTAPEPPTTGQLWYDTDDATISVYTGNTWVVTSGPAGPVGADGQDGYLIWTKQTSDYTASPNEGVMADTSANTFTITLPSSPSVGDIVVIGDANDLSNNSVIVAPSLGDTIEGVSDSFELDVAQNRVDFIYDGTTWQVFSNSGPQGPVGPSGPQGIDGTVAEVSNTAPTSNTVGQLWFDTDDATISVYTGNTWVVTSGPSGPIGPAGQDGYLTWTVQTSDYTASTNEGVIADTTANTFVLTLPSSPNAGDIVVIADGNDWSINNLTVTTGNGETIEGANNDFDIDVGKTRIDFIYSGSTWKVYTNQGPQGPQGPQAPTAYALSLIFN